VGPRTSLDAVLKRKIPSPARNLNVKVRLSIRKLFKHQLLSKNEGKELTYSSLLFLISIFLWTNDRRECVYYEYITNVFARKRKDENKIKQDSRYSNHKKWNKKENAALEYKMELSCVVRWIQKFILQIYRVLINF